MSSPALDTRLLRLLDAIDEPVSIGPARRRLLQHLAAPGGHAQARLISTDR